MKRLDFASVGELTFLPLDNEKFPSIQRARWCLQGANGAAAVLNTANEVAVSSFLGGAISFESILTVVGDALECFGSRRYASLEELFGLTSEVTEWARQRTGSSRH
jgi:1-deoxy-D-xylulose-5-phosphate reductoisomerase